MATLVCTSGRRSHLEFMPFIPTTIECERFTTLRIDQAKNCVKHQEAFLFERVSCVLLFCSLTGKFHSSLKELTRESRVLAETRLRSSRSSTSIVLRGSVEGRYVAGPSSSEIDETYCPVCLPAMRRADCMKSRQGSYH